MKQTEKVLDAIVKTTSINKQPMAVETVRYSHVENRGVVCACLVAITKENGIWIYLSRQLYTSLKHEVYARLHGVEYQEYLEMQDYNQALYPEPTAGELIEFFEQFTAEFMPLRSIADHTALTTAQEAEAPSSSNAEHVAFLVIASPLNA